MIFHGELAEISEPSPPRRNFCFPLFFLLIPQLAAFSFCANVPWLDEISPVRWLAAGTAFFALAAFSAIAAAKTRGGEVPAKTPFAGIWEISFPLAAFFIFVFWWQTFGIPPRANWEDRPPRDAQLVLRVERAFFGSEKNFNGFARVENAGDDYFSRLAGTRVWFAFPKKFYPENVPAPAEGMRFRGDGIVRPVPAESDLPDDGFFAFLRNERASAIFSRVENPEILPGGSGAFARWCSARKADLREALTRISSDESGNISRAGRTLGAMLLGERSLLLPEQKENFLLTGTIHIFAISGLHISILATGTLGLFLILRAPFVPAAIATSAVLWFYVQIVGAPPSAMRAWMMFVFILVGHFFGRGRMAFHGLLCSAFFALLIEPSVLENVGFRLSYFVVAAILLYGIPLAEFLKKAIEPRIWVPDSEMSLPSRGKRFFARRLCDGFAISFSAFLAGTPIVGAMFGICSFVSLPANVLLIPFVSLAVCLGAAAVVCACIPFAGTFLGKCVFWLAAFPLNFIDFTTAWLSRASVGIAEIAFPWRALGIIGGILMFAVFFSGEAFPPIRSRAWLRFGAPPLVLTLFLLLFSL